MRETRNATLNILHTSVALYIFTYSHNHTLLLSEAKIQTAAVPVAAIATAAVTPPGSHIRLYTKFYSQAYHLATSPVKQSKENSSNENEQQQQQQQQQQQSKQLQQKILITLNTITKLTFGLDGTKKSQMVLHGAGVLELIIALVKRANTDTKKKAANDNNGLLKQIQSGALNAIKTYVLCNPAGRSRCQLAGVLSFLSNVLNSKNESTTGSKTGLAEEAYTTLLALCLGDDLNALQASTEFKPCISKSKQVFVDANAKSMHQKTLYLETLFDAVQKEQVKLLKKVKTTSNTAKFFKDLVETETNIRTGFSHLQDGKYAMAVKHYNHAMKLITPFLDDTALLDEMVVEIRFKRAKAALELGKAEDCLEDTKILLERQDTSAGDVRVDLLKIHGKALIKSGNVQEGKATLSKLRLMCPQDNDEEIAKLLESVKVES